MPELLSISIPTRNRSQYLSKLLHSIESQVKSDPDILNYLKVYIYDNASEDNTAEIVNNSELPVCYKRNDINIGANPNILQAYTATSGEYVWVIGDDELLPDMALHYVLFYLKKYNPHLFIANDPSCSSFVDLPVIADSYRSFAELMIKYNPHMLIAHSLISSNILLKKCFDADIVLQKMETLYGHFYGITSGLKKNPGPVVWVKEATIKVSEQRASPNDYNASWNSRIEMGQAGYLEWLKNEYCLELGPHKQILSDYRKRLAADRKNAGHTHKSDGRLTINIVYGHMSQSDIFTVNRGNVSIIWSHLPIEGCDHYAYHNSFSFRGRLPGLNGLNSLNILIMLEPAVVLPGEFDERVWRHFDHVLVLFDALVGHGKKFHKILFPRFDGSAKVPVTEPADQRALLYPLTGRKNAICMISGNKSSHIPGELYSKRIEAAEWFYKNSEIPFDVYGKPSFPLSNYLGVIPEDQKIAVLKQYRFSLCFENTDHPVLSAGYVTEKILDCLEARTVPIYLGASNIEKYIPGDCFIDFRKFSGLEELDCYLRNMSSEKYIQYIEAIDRWVGSGKLRDYSSSSLYDLLAGLCASASSMSPEALFAGDRTWTKVKAYPTMTGSLRYIDSTVLWTWKHLSKADLPLLKNEKNINDVSGLKDRGAVETIGSNHKSFLIGKKPFIKVLFAGLKFSHGSAARGYDYCWWNLYDALQRFENIKVQIFEFTTETQQMGIAGMSDRLTDILRRDKPDVFLHIPSEFNVGILHEGIRSITGLTDTRTLIWTGDDFYVSEDYGKQLALCYDYIVATSEDALDKYKNAGWGEKVIKSQWACNPFTYSPLSVCRTRDVSFAGTANDTRFTLIGKMYQNGLKVDTFGSGWPGGMDIPVQDMKRIFSQTKVNLNIGESFSAGQNIKRRNFEVPGCRGLLLTTPADGLKECYDPGKEIVVASSSEEMIDKCRYYLAHEREREMIAQRGYERTLAEHTWIHRLKDIFHRIGLTAVVRQIPEAVPSPLLQAGTSNLSAGLSDTGAVPQTADLKDYDNITVSINVIAFNQLEHTKLCVSSILHYTSDPYQLILTDNGSTDGTFEYFESIKLFHPYTIVIRNYGNRIAEAVGNYAYSLSAGKYIVCITNDTIVHEGWLEKLIRHIESAPDIGMVGPRSNNVSGPQMTRGEYDSLESFQTFAADWSRMHSGSSFMIDRVVGFFFIIKKEIYERIGGNDPDLSTNGRDGGYGFSDDDFTIRVRLAGYKSIVANDVFIHHFGGVTASKYRRDMFGPALNINKEKFEQKLLRNDRVIKGQQGEIILRPYRQDDIIPVSENTVIRFPRVCIFRRGTEMHDYKDNLNHSAILPDFIRLKTIFYSDDSMLQRLNNWISKWEYDVIVLINRQTAVPYEKICELIYTSLCYPDVAILVPVGNYAPSTHAEQTEKGKQVEIIQYADLSLAVLNVKAIRPCIRGQAHSHSDDEQELFWFLQRRVRGEGYYIAKANNVVINSDIPCLNHPYDSYVLPEILMGDKRYAEAEAVYKDDMSKDPFFVDSVYMLACIAREQHKIDVAIQHAENAIRIDPHHIQSLILLAGIFMDQDEIKRAREVVRLANLKQPGNPEVQKIVARFEQCISECNTRHIQTKGAYTPESGDVFKPPTDLRVDKINESFANVRKLIEAGKEEDALQWLTDSRIALTSLLQSQINNRYLHTHLNNIRNIEYNLSAQLNKVHSPHLRQLFIEVTKRCNIHCKMCQFIINPERKKGAPKKDYDMPLEMFENICSQIPVSLQSIALYGDGEPLLAPDYDKMFTMLYGLGLNIGFSSNGMLLTERYQKLFLDKNIGIWISFDAAGKETFNSIRTGAKWDTVLDNIKSIQQMKQKNSTQFPVLHFSFTALRENIMELPAVVRLAAELGIASITVQYMNVSYESLRNESLYYHQELSNLKMREAEALGNKLGVKVMLPPSFGGKHMKQPKPWRKCKFVNSQMIIYCDGRVKTCACGVVEQFMGDFKKESLMDIWYGGKYKSLRSSFETDTPPLICANCPDLSQRDVNNINTHIHIRDTTSVPIKYKSPPSPLVTVMVRTLNRPDMLRECIESICNQTYKNIEIVVVNDGGPDIKTIIDEFKSRINIIYKRHDCNLGRSAAWNSAINSANGKYVSYLDDDDIYYPGHIHTLVNALEKNHGTVAYTDTYQATQMIVNGVYQITDRKIVYSNDFDRTLIKVTNYIPIINIMHRRDCIDKTGMFDTGMAVLEDWDFLNRLADSYEFIHIPEITGEYRWRDDNSNATFFDADKFGKNRAKVWMRYGSHYEGIKPLVSIIILCYNNIKYTKLCIESIHSCTEGPYEIVIVDNNSTDGSVEYFKELESLYTNIKLILNKENLGYALGNNQGLMAAAGEYIVVMNNDVVVTDGWLSGLLRTVNDIPDIGISGPVTNNVVGSQKIPGVICNSIEDIEEFACKFKAEAEKTVTITDRVIGFCMLIKRKVIEKIGGFDPRFGLGNFEDDDFCHRAIIAGFKVAIADFVFVHHFRNVSFNLMGSRQYKELLDNNIKKFFRKWGIPEESTAKKYYSSHDFKEISFDHENHYIPFNSNEYLKQDILSVSIDGAKRFSILSIPEWSSDKNGWMKVIDAYINTFNKGDDTTLIFYLDTSMEESEDKAGLKIESYLKTKGLSTDDVPDIMILALPIPFSNRGTLYKSVDLLMATGDFMDHLHTMEAVQCGIPVVIPSDTNRLRELYEGVCVY